MAAVRKHTDRSMAGLRDTLFDVLDALRNGDMDDREAMAAAKLGETILHSAEVQMDYERLILDNKVPAVLPDMALNPPLKEKP